MSRFPDLEIFWIFFRTKCPDFIFVNNDVNVHNIDIEIFFDSYKTSKISKKNKSLYIYKNVMKDILECFYPKIKLYISSHLAYEPT